MDSLTTGINALDQVTGGLPRSKSYLLCGASDAPKSLAGLQFAVAGLQRGERVLYICCQKAADLIRQAEGLGLGLGAHIDDERLVVLECHGDGLREIVKSKGGGAVLKQICRDIDGAEISRVVFDPIDPFLPSLGEPSRLREELSAITRPLEARGWTVLLLSDRATPSAEPGAIDALSEVCWGIFELKRKAGAQDSEHELLIHRMSQAPEEHLALRIGQGGLQAPTAEERGDTSPFSRFRRAARAAEDTAPAAAKAPSGEGAASPGPSSAPRKPAAAPVAPTVPTRPQAGGAGKPNQPAPEPPRSADAQDAARPMAPQAAPPQPRAAAAVPAAAPSAQATGPAPAKPQAARRPQRPVALIVDPDANARRQVTEALAHKLQVLQSSDGIEGLEAAVKQRPDLLLLEIATPRLSGQGVCAILRKHGANVPVLFLSERLSETDERVRCLLVGGDDTLLKPFDVRELRAKAGRLLARAKSAGASLRWPQINIPAAITAFTPSQAGQERADGPLTGLLACARKARIPICLVGYEFRPAAGDQGLQFIERFSKVVAESIRAKDSIFRLPSGRLIVLLLDTDREGAQLAIQRVHQMTAEARRSANQASVKPEVLCRTLVVEHDQPEKGDTERDLITRLFEQQPLAIEEGVDGRPGQPVEKFPMLEAVFVALYQDAKVFVEPNSGKRCPIRSDASGALRSVTIDRMRYRTQDPRENSAAGMRAQQGVHIVWIERRDDSGSLIGRIEDGRIFAGRGD